MAAANTPSSAGISSPSDSIIITSPTPSTSPSSSSSFDFVTDGQQLDPEGLTSAAMAAITSLSLADTEYREISFSDEDSDRVVWSLSETSDSDLEGSRGTVFSDDDFVVLSRASSPTSRPERLEATAASTSTIRCIPIPFGPDSILDEGVTDQDSGSTHTTETVEAFPFELAGLNVNSKRLSGVGKAPVNSVSSPSINKGRKKVKKTPEENQAKAEKRREKKERKKQNKIRRELKRKKKEAEKQAAEKEVLELKELNDAITAPKTKERASPAILAPGSSKRASETTTALSSSSAAGLECLPLHKALHPGEQTGCTPSPNPPSGIHVSLSSHPPGAIKTPAVTAKPRKKKKYIKVAGPSTGSFQSPAVAAEKVSEQASNQDLSSEVYEFAVDFITTYLSNPSVRRDQACHLALLQSLIIELGLLSDRKLLPQSIKSAKKFIKAHIFINIGEYLTRRHEGYASLKELMYGSKSALVRDLKRKKNTVSPARVKEVGLQDLLVSTFRRL